MDPLVLMKRKENWFWCEDFNTRTNLAVCEERVHKGRSYYPCNTCTRWRERAQRLTPSQGKISSPLHS